MHAKGPRRCTFLQAHSHDLESEINGISTLPKSFVHLRQESTTRLRSICLAFSFHICHNKSFSSAYTETTTIKRRTEYMAIKIFIDQGHNPQNPNAGAEGNGVREQDITYEVGVILAALLNNDSDFEARLSRNSPTEILGTSNTTSLQTRVYEANLWGADYFISLHCNSNPNPNSSGSEAYVYSADSTAFNMALRILQGLNYNTGLENRGVFVRPTLYVLRATDMPSVLVEMGYISNGHDAYLMSNDPESFAMGIYNGILLYYGLL